MSAEGAFRGVLEPFDRFSEILCALIMVLTFTCSMGVADADRADVRAMIVGALGCNLAWAIIDAAFYGIGALSERGRNQRFLLEVKRASEPAEGRRIVSGALPDAVADSLPPEALERMRLVVAGLPAPEGRPRLTRSDVLGALAVFLLVFLSTFPVVLPFFFVGDFQAALRVSNGVAIATMFAAGFKLAQHSGLPPWWTASAIVALGGGLVAVAIALGG